MRPRTATSVRGRDAPSLCLGFRAAGHMAAIPMWLVKVFQSAWAPPDARPSKPPRISLASLAWAWLKQTVSGISAPMNMRQPN